MWWGQHVKDSWLSLHSWFGEDHGIEFGSSRCLKWSGCEELRRFYRLEGTFWVDGIQYLFSMGRSWFASPFPEILPSWWDCQSGIRWARSFPQKALMRFSLAGIEWRRLRMVTDSYLSQNLKWLRVKSNIDLMSPTKIDPQSVYKKNQSEISWGPGGGRVLPGRVRELRKLGKMRRTGLGIFCWAVERTVCRVLIHPTCLGYPGMIIRIEDGQKPTVKFFLASVLQKYGGVPEGFGSKSLLFFNYGCLADWLQCVNWMVSTWIMFV